MLSLAVVVRLLLVFTVFGVPAEPSTFAECSVEFTKVYLNALFSAVCHLHVLVLTFACGRTDDLEVRAVLCCLHLARDHQRIYCGALEQCSKCGQLKVCATHVETK